MLCLFASLARDEGERGRRKGIWAWVWLGFALLVMSPAGHADVLSSATGVVPSGLQELSHRAFRPEDGAPTTCVVLAQTADGLIWIGNHGGLYRYDGARFDARLSKRLPQRSIQSLLAEPDGGLWIGYTFGGVSLWRHGDLYNYDWASLPQGAVKQLLRDGEGTLWASTSRGLAMLRGERWQSADPKMGYSGESPLWLGVVSGRFAVETRTATYLYMSAAKRFERRPRFESEAARYGIPPGSSWRPDLHDTAEEVPTQTLLDRRGTLWVSGFRTLVRYRWNSQADAVPRQDQFTVAMGLSGDVSSIMEDREGNIWVGTDKGLDRFSIPAVQRVAFPDGAFNSLLIPGEQGDVWVARTGHPIVRLEPMQDISQLGVSVMTAFRGQDGTLWSAGQNGVFEYAHGTARPLPLPVSVAQAPDIVSMVSSYQAIAVDRSGAVWLSIGRVGLFRWDGKRWEKAEALYALPPGPAIRLTVDGRGRLWMAYPDNQLAVLEDGRLKVFKRADGLRVGNVLAVDVEPTHVWVGGDQGVAALVDHHFIPVIGRGDVDFHVSTGIAETARGELWLNAADGIYRIPSAEVRRLLAGDSRPVEFEAFDWIDGVNSVVNPVRPGPSILNSTDGRLWFSRYEGVWSIDPEHIHRNLVAPLVSIEDLMIGAVRYETNVPIDLPRNTRNLSINYTAASYTYPERTRFRYRLVGVDEGWQEAGERRQAFYTNLSPGQYEFRVRAVNKDGVWSAGDAMLHFTVAPAFYQTMTFKMGLGVMAALGLLLLFFGRLEQVNRRYRRAIEARLAERERIARDLHDTLLQGVQALLLRLQLWAASPAIVESLREQMGEVVEHTRAMVLEGRERILMMRTTDALPADLTEALAAIGNEASVGKQAAFEVRLEGAERALTVDAKQQLVDIAREAVRNAYQHAAARHIRITLRYGRHSLRMTVVDDGGGMDAAVVERKTRSSHFGLVGMRERATQLGARFRLNSRVGAGTRIEVTVPGGMAFRDAFRWPWQRKGCSWRRGFNLRRAAD